MILAFLKIDRIDEHDAGKVIEVLAGGIVLKHKGQTIQSMEPVAIEMAHDGMFKNTVHDMQFEVYEDQSIFPSGEIVKSNLFSVLAAEDVQRAIYKEVAKRCKVVPIWRVIDERELFCREFEYAYMQILGV